MDMLAHIQRKTPHSWNPDTLKCFPSMVSEFYAQVTPPRFDKILLKNNVETECRVWKSGLKMFT